MRLKDAIDTAVTILNDDGVTYARSDLLRYANDALDAMLLLAPHLFYEIGDLKCIPGETVQVVPFADAHALVSVLRIKGGNALNMFDKATMDMYHPGWHLDPAGPARGWCPDASENSMRFYIWPKAPADQILEVVYVRVPKEYSETEEIGLPATYAGAIIDFIVASAESRDDEHVNSGRATMFYNKFLAYFKKNEPVQPLK